MVTFLAVVTVLAVLHSVGSLVLLFDAKKKIEEQDSIIVCLQAQVRRHDIWQADKDDVERERAQQTLVPAQPGGAYR